ncbi:hypothetical protein IEQ44_03495 [Nocardioides sp. Y6]|uniref:Uncharacterized protein n=1 Tax=Nocardioides malaquae TaxID=2773426 RepID=A0ABR9RQ74_9ACTN|nr:hypothetical protein [Nocardioides malaquae]MBE7323716.1 hypothetical protein [Nocardioides malaquae]
MIWSRSPGRTSVPTLARGERELARAVAEDGTVLVGTRDAFHLVPANDGEARRIPWEQVEAAEWEADTSTFRLSEVGEWGQDRPEHSFVLEDARLLLEMVHERVTASIVLQRDLQVAGGGVRVIARRAPHGDGALAWVYEYDAGVDPEDPVVRAAAAAALHRAKEEVGDL